MNPDEQKQHRKATQDLAKRQDDSDTVILALDQRLSDVVAVMAKEVEALRRECDDNLLNEIAAREEGDRVLREEVVRHRRGLDALRFWRDQGGWAGLRNRWAWLWFGRV